MKYSLVIAALLPVLVAGCMSASQHRQAVQDDTGEKVTVGTVQKEIHVGMSSAEVATVLDMPT